MIVSHEVFVAIVAGMTLFVTGTNGVRDVFLLRRLLRDREADNRHDRIFGMIVGIFLMIFAYAGVIKYYWL